MKIILVTSEIKRTRLGYRPTSNVWYYRVLYYIYAMISITNVHLRNMLNMRSGYKYPRCGKKYKPPVIRDAIVRGVIDDIR